MKMIPRLGFLTPMVFFSDLPHDLFKSITEEYLQIDVHQLSCLDVAHCNHKQRSDLLALMRGTRASYPRKRIASGAIAGYLQWMISRAVHVSRLAIGRAAFQDSRLSSLGPLPGVKEVTIFDEDMPTPRDTATLLKNVVQFLNQFPVIGMLYFWLSMDSTQLPALHCLTCRLEGVSLTSGHWLKFGVPGMANFLIVFGHHLKVLRCECIDGQLLPAIAEHCHCLTTLNIKCQYPNVETAKVLEQICAVNASTLKTLHLHADVPSQAIMRMISACKNLENFAADSNFSLRLQELLIFCCRLKEIRLSQFTVTMAPLAGSGGQMAADVKSLSDTLNQLEFLAAISVPVRLYQAIFYDASGVCAVLNDLAARFGLTLESLQIGIRTPTNGDQLETDAAVRNLLLHCPNLTFISMNPWCDGLLALATCCSRLRHLVLHGRHAMSPEPLLHTFLAKPNNTISEFVLPFASVLTPEILLAICDAFPKLRVLSVLTGVEPAAGCQEVFLDLIMSNKLKAKQMRAHRSCVARIVEHLQKLGIHHRYDRDTRIRLPLD